MNNKPSSNSPADSEYDYIIVGSGAGGAPLAARLAEYRHRVLVLEAGQNRRGDNLHDSEVSEVPALHPAASEDRSISWDFFVNHYTKPAFLDPKEQPEGQGIFYPRATGIGGCTAHNAMITIVGPASDWDELAWYLNDPTWAADVMRGYFQKLEHCEYLQEKQRPRGRRERLRGALRWLIGKEVDPTQGRHGFHGWLHTSMVNPRLGLMDSQLFKMLKAALKTSQKAGLESPFLSLKRILKQQFHEELDPNHFRRQAERPEGVVLVPTAIYSSTTKDFTDRGRRSSAGRRLWEASRNPSNHLHLATDCLVTEIVFDHLPNKQWRAIGVKYLHGQNLYQACPLSENAEVKPSLNVVHARKEVILCGGTFNTPQLLMLSGIGPREHLDKIQIPCKVHSPGVGKNLQDRYEVTIISKLKSQFSLLQGASFQPSDNTTADRHLQEWRHDGGGLYGTNGAVLGIFKRSRPELPQPDLFIFGVPLKFEGYAQGYSKVSPTEFDLFTWAILKGHTRNKAGDVTLKSSDPRERPVINFRYFNDDQPAAKLDPDLEAMLAGVKFVREIADNAGVVHEEHHPRRSKDDNSPKIPAETDDEIRDFIRREAWGHHACGTCRLGRRTDALAVIDSRFRVMGESAPKGVYPRERPLIQGLRVVDASIFPTIPGYFIVSNLYMASEKAADLIHQDS